MKTKSRLQSIYRFYVISIVIVLLYYITLKTFCESTPDFTTIINTAVTSITTATGLLIGRYGVRESILSSKAAPEMVTKIINKAVEK